MDEEVAMILNEGVDTDGRRSKKSRVDDNGGGHQRGLGGQAQAQAQAQARTQSGKGDLRTIGDGR
jgi:hypothetical protein